MMKLSDVCKTIGVTRRTLQEYAKIGLLEPTKKTIGGYWYYDEDAVATLQHILIFVEAGYERKQIKEIINMRKPEILDEYDKAIKLLREKQEKIDGMILMPTMHTEGVFQNASKKNTSGYFAGSLPDV